LIGPISRPPFEGQAYGSAIAISRRGLWSAHVNSARSAYLTGKLEYSTLLAAIQRRYQMEVAFAEALSTFHSKITELETIVGQQFGDSP